MSSTSATSKVRPVADLPDGRKLHLPDLADLVRLNRRSRREAVRAAVADASAGWLPNEDHLEPEHCRKVDQEFLVVATRLCVTADRAAAELLTTLRLFLELDEVAPPPPSAVGPEARRSAEQARRYAAFEASAYAAWSAWELAWNELIGELKSRDALRRASRAAYAAALSARHPRPDLLPPLEGEPDLCLRQAPLEPAVVEAMRTRLQGLAPAELVGVPS